MGAVRAACALGPRRPRAAPGGAADDDDDQRLHGRQRVRRADARHHGLRHLRHRLRRLLSLLRSDALSNASKIWRAFWGLSASRIIEFEREHVMPEEPSKQ